MPRSSESPSLIRLEGEVTGIGFEPGNPEIRILSNGRSFTSTATAEQVESALSLRGTRVQALLLHRPSSRFPRLLWIRSCDRAVAVPSFEQIADELVTKWDEALRRLAK